MLKPNGYGSGLGPEWRGGKAESDLVTCIHCGKIDMVRPGLGQPLAVMVFRADNTHYFKEAGYCASCDAAICPSCDGKPCSNRFKRLEVEETQARKFICL